MLKRSVDFFGTFTGLIVFIIPILVIAVIIRFTMGKPILFKQTRPGLNTRPFVIYKFRTMNILRDDTGDLLPPRQRLTAFGRFLRNTSLDELPELINVLKGDMSLVGPRPLLMKYLPLYNERQKLRHTVKPGLTGWAQVNGRNAINWEKKFELDVWYVNHQSFFLDLKIIWLTVKEVLSREGIYRNSDMKMFPFSNSEDGGENND